MIKIYKDNRLFLPNHLYIEFNDIFFNCRTSQYIDNRAKDIIRDIDGSELCGKYTIKSKFNSTILDIDKLSTGCKTTLNILYNPKAIVNISGCGNNALEMIYNLHDGFIFCEYPMIPFSFNKVEVIDNNGSHIISDYDELLSWWKTK